MTSLEHTIQCFVASLQEKHEVLGAMLAGSYVSGTMSPRSDIDLFLIWGDAKRSMRGRTVFEGVEFEYFFSPEWKYHERMRADLTAQQIYATGRILLDTDGVYYNIQQQAKQHMQQYAPAVGAQQRADDSFRVETVWKDGLDLLDAGKRENFRFLTGQSIPLLCDMAARVHDGYPVYAKYAMEQLTALAPDLAGHVKNVLKADKDAHLRAAWTGLCTYVLELLGNVDIREYQSITSINKGENN